MTMTATTRSGWKYETDFFPKKTGFTALPPGRYQGGTNQLKIVKYLGTKELTNGSTRHTFLVAAEIETPSTRGTAFLKIDMRPEYQYNEMVALAKGKEAEATEAGDLSSTVLEEIRTALRTRAETLVAAANTPTESFDDAVDKSVESQLKSAQINLRILFALQDYADQDRDQTGDIASLDGTVFGGAVKEGFQGSSEVTVFEKPKSKSK